MENYLACDAEEEKRKRINIYKTALKYYQSRNLSLEIILRTNQETENVPDNFKSYKMLGKMTTTMLDDVKLLISMKDCLKTINNTLACSELFDVRDLNLIGELLDKVKGIIHFSREIMKLHQSNFIAMELLEKKRSYASALDAYGEHLKSLKSMNHEPSEEDSEAMKKAELQVYKINLIRAIKAILIGYTTANHPSLIKKFDQYNCTLRRNLTIDDFVESWDVGLPLKKNHDFSS